MTDPILQAARRRPWQPGETVGRYGLLAKIAVGGMAEIWLARQAGLKGFEKVVVIKKISDIFSEDPEFVEMFLDEARIAAQLNHPNIVQIYDLGEKEGAYYIAMEYLPGEHLAAVARASNKVGRRLPMAYSARLIASAADGLGYAHARAGMDGKPLNIVHRDVSPQNLIITYDGTLKLVDFGIAKAANRASHTSDGKFKGKAAYMSPEQALGMEIDGRSDVFALGVVLFEAVTSSRLFQFDEPMAAFAAIAGSRPIPSARERNPDVPPALDAIISRALARDREKRFQSAKELQAELEEWLRKQDDAPTTAAIADFMRSLFEERIRQRERLLEAASAGDLGRATESVSSSLRDDNERSMPGGSAPGRRSALRARRPNALVTGLTLAALGAGGGLLWTRASAARRAPRAPPHVLVVETEPVGADISIDTKPRGKAPLTLSDLPVGEHTLVATLEGYAQATRVVKLSPGERQALVLNLPTLPRPDPPPSPPSPPPAPAPAPPGAVDTSKHAKGRLTLNTEPWTNVYLGNRKLGETPLINVTVPAGHQVLQLINREEGIKRRLEVDIEVGKTTVKKLHL